MNKLNWQLKDTVNCFTERRPMWGSDLRPRVRVSCSTDWVGPHVFKLVICCMVRINYSVCERVLSFSHLIHIFYCSKRSNSSCPIYFKMKRKNECNSELRLDLNK